MRERVIERDRGRERGVEGQLGPLRLRLPCGAFHLPSLLVAVFSALIFSLFHFTYIFFAANSSALLRLLLSPRSASTAALFFLFLLLRFA